MPKFRLKPYRTELWAFSFVGPKYPSHPKLHGKLDAWGSIQRLQKVCFKDSFLLKIPIVTRYFTYISGQIIFVLQTIVVTIFPMIGLLAQNGLIINWSLSSQSDYSSTFNLVLMLWKNISFLMRNWHYEYYKILKFLFWSLLCLSLGLQIQVSEDKILPFGPI